MAPESNRDRQRHSSFSRIQSRNSCSVVAIRAGLLPAALWALTATSAWAVSCTTQASMQQQDREALLAAGNSIAGAVAGQSFDQLQASLLPAVIGDWDGIRAVAQGGAPLLKGGKLYWGDGYLLDATDLKGPADTQFFCTNADSAATMTITLRSLPAGRYALLIGDYEGSPMAGQLALILGTDTTVNASTGNPWKLGGLFVREGAFDSHDGVWYWRRARELAGKKDVWSAWFSYDAARWLLLPVDFLSSPHMEKLNREQLQLASNPTDLMPLTVTGNIASEAGGTAIRSWKIDSVHLDASLHMADLAVIYEGTGLTDPQASRAEAIAVMSAFLKQHPELRENFHGLWAYAEKDGRRSFAIELAMHDIP